MRHAAKLQAFRWLPLAELVSSRADNVRAGMPQMSPRRSRRSAASSTAGSRSKRPPSTRRSRASTSPARSWSTKDLAYGPHERQRVDVHTRATPARRPGAGDRRVPRRRAHRRQPRRDDECRRLLREPGLRRRQRRLSSRARGQMARGRARHRGRRHLAARSRRRVRRRSRSRSSSRESRPAPCTRRPTCSVPSSCRPTRRGRPGAILVSGPYTFDFAAAGRGELAYFGEDRSRWPEMVVTGPRHARRHPGAHDDGRMGQRALHEAFRGAVRRARHGARCHAALSAEPRPQPLVAALVRRHVRTKACPASSSTSSSARAAAEGAGVPYARGPVAQLVRAGDSSKKVPSRRRAAKWTG